jgi:uncharacterized protein
MWTRRAFLRSAGAGFAASLLPRQAAALERSEAIFASSMQQADGTYGAALVSETGDVIMRVPLPGRGHDVTFSAEAGRAVVFARQPGTFAVVFDPAGREAPLTIPSIEGRHFFGHGAFTADGRLLYVTENDFESGQGVLGIYDVSGGFSRIGEVPTYGIGPHEVLLSPDGRVIVVANGGIETHPDFGRAELNIETMDPSLVFLDVATGELIGQMRLSVELHQLSIRHLAFDALGRVWFGCQFRGAPETMPQLAGYATMDGEIRLIELPPDQLGALRNYVGSVAASRDGSTIAISSPEGDTVLAIDAASARPSASLVLRNGCGIAADGAGFLASSGEGEIVGFAGSAAASRTLDIHFDNHLRALRA